MNSYVSFKNPITLIIRQEWTQQRSMIEEKCWKSDILAFPIKNVLFSEDLQYCIPLNEIKKVLEKQWYQVTLTQKSENFSLF